MKSRWCIGPAYKTRDGKFWFPTSVGVAMIDPNQIKTNPTPPPLMIEKIIIDGKTIKIKNICAGGLKNEGWKGGSVEGEKGRTLKRSLKDSKPFLNENSNTLHDNQHFDVFSAESVQSKKPSGGPKGLIGPPCHGAPGKTSQVPIVLTKITGVVPH